MRVISKKILLVFVVVTVFTTVLIARDKWVRGSNGHIYGSTVIGGSEPGRSRLFLCAGYKNGTYHPGKIVGQNCNFGYGGREITQRNYYTLNVSKSNIWRYKWYQASNGQIPRVNGYVPIPVGREGSRTLYVCRANYRGGIHPGKIVGNNCNFGYGGREILIANYQVLMYNRGR